jgi:hypothetical protein
MPRDRVTICLYSTERDDGSFYDVFAKEKESIQRMSTQLAEQARLAGKEPPEIVVSLLLIPNWKKAGNSYDNSEYQEVEAKFMESAREQLSGTSVTVENFYRKSPGLTLRERNYMHGLITPADNLDLMKNHVVIQNRDRQHLQLDSNTKVVDYHKLYQETFASSPPQDAFTACYYASRFVSGQNKIVFTVPGGEFSPALAERYGKFFAKEEEDLAKLGAEEVQRRKSEYRMYGEIFGPALTDVGLATRKEKADGSPYYGADLSKTASYRATPAVVHAINMSWAAGIAQNKLLNNIPPASVGDALCDYPCFTYVVKKYTGDLSAHWCPEDKAERRAELLNLSNSSIDYQLLREFYHSTCVYHPELAEDVVNIIPETSEGRALVEAAFQCSYEQLIDHAKQTVLGASNSHRTASFRASETDMASTRLPQLQGAGLEAPSGPAPRRADAATTPPLAEPRQQTPIPRHTASFRATLTGLKEADNAHDDESHDRPAGRLGM